jgi:nucleoside 2-deoxyribosyltransferase
MPILRTVPEKMNGLLKALAESELPPGTPIAFDFQRDYPLIFAANWREAQFLLGELSSRRFVSPAGNTGRYQLTADGYERVEQLEAASHKSTRNAFVAMWFDKSRDLIYTEAIEPAIREAGYMAIRIDRTEHVNRIDDEIIAQLRQSRFLVADFTGQRAGVYYEAGFMHGLGRNVFWMVEKAEIGKVHFDVRQYNFIDYDSSSEAKSRLNYRIMAVEGRGPMPATAI